MSSEEQPLLAKATPRRVIVKSAAWSVPVFAAVGVSPAFACSVTDIHVECGSMHGRRHDGSWDRRVDFTWTCETTCPPDHKITSITMGTPSCDGMANWSLPGTITHPDRTCDIRFSGYNRDREQRVPDFTFPVTVTCDGRTGRTTTTSVVSVSGCTVDDQETRLDCRMR